MVLVNGWWEIYIDSALLVVVSDWKVIGDVFFGDGQSHLEFLQDALYVDVLLSVASENLSNQVLVLNRLWA